MLFKPYFVKPLCGSKASALYCRMPIFVYNAQITTNDDQLQAANPSGSSAWVVLKLLLRARSLHAFIRSVASRRVSLCSHTLHSNRDENVPMRPILWDTFCGHVGYVQESYIDSSFQRVFGLWLDVL